MDKEDNSKYYDTLRKSPMFQLSLSSKELFHSNFLYWISTVSSDMFKDVISGLYACVNELPPTDLWPDNYEVKREADHFDLCVVEPVVVKKKRKGEEKTEHKVIFILENKVKSIPSLSQLDEYKGKSKEAGGRLLLSLADEFPGRDEVLSKISKDWTLVNYNMLSEVLINLANGKYSDKLNDYQHTLIMDYSESIKALHNIQKDWCVKMESPFFLNDPQLKRLRIADVKDKMRFSQMSVLLHSSLKKLKGLTDKIILDADRKNIFKDNPSKIGSIFIGWGMTRAQGLLEIKILIESNVVLLIQIQGDQYRHGIELYDSGKSDQENWKVYSDYPSTGWFLNSFKQSYGEIRPTNKEYNKFGNEFLYKSITIPEKTSVGDIINMIADDCSDILSMSIGTYNAD